jgi:predicted RNA-binding protein YlqC (UPF0109 family)
VPDQAVSETREQLLKIVSLIVDEPDAVEIEEHQEGRTTVFELQVATDDLGKVIGRQGRTARAFRSLLMARGTQDGCRYDLEILDD